MELKGIWHVLQKRRPSWQPSWISLGPSICCLGSGRKKIRKCLLHHHTKGSNSRMKWTISWKINDLVPYYLALIGNNDLKYITHQCKFTVTTNTYLFTSNLFKYSKYINNIFWSEIRQRSTMTGWLNYKKRNKSLILTAK